jgi:hypothetical protein
MIRIRGMTVLLASILILTIGFASGKISSPEKESVQYDFIIIVHGVFSDTTYYSDNPPMYGSNCVMFIDAITGLLIVEIAPRITARSTMPEPIPTAPSRKNKLKRYLICKR